MVMGRIFGFMKFLVFFIGLTMLSVAHGQTKKKLVFGVTSSINRTIKEQIIIGDYDSKIKGIRQPLGFTIGGKMRYNGKNRTSFVVGLNLFSLHRLRYFYQGSTRTNSFGLSSISIEGNYAFLNTKKSFFLIYGIDLMYTPYSFFNMMTMESPFNPTYAVNTITKEGVYFVPKLGLGFSLFGRSNLQGFMTFSKGFVPISTYTLERFDPYARSAFNYNGSRIEVGINWYFKRKKK